MTEKNKQLHIKIDSKLGAVHGNYLLTSTTVNSRCKNTSGSELKNHCTCGKKGDTCASKNSKRPQYIREHSNAILNPLMNSLVTEDVQRIESDKFELRQETK